jgi:hypothetical protein
MRGSKCMIGPTSADLRALQAYSNGHGKIMIECLSTHLKKHVADDQALTQAVGLWPRLAIFQELEWIESRTHLMRSLFCGYLSTKSSNIVGHNLTSRGVVDVGLGHKSYRRALYLSNQHIAYTSNHNSFHEHKCKCDGDKSMHRKAERPKMGKTAQRTLKAAGHNEVGI